MTPGRVEHAAFSLMANPSPGFFRIAFNSIRQYRTAFFIVLRMNVSLIPILDRSKTFHDRMVRLNDRLFKHTRGMVIKSRPH